MSRFKEGDIVVIIAEEHQDYWSERMDKYIGQTVKVYEVSDKYSDRFYIYDEDTGCRWFFYNCDALLLSEYEEPKYDCDLQDLNALLTIGAPK